jgi:tRNA dimethylallyltransferase
VKPFLAAVMGPTASGKSAAAEALAEATGARLINADAFQVYRGFDIGTSKPDRPERYALIDVLDPHEQGGAGWWVRLALAELEEAFSLGQSCVIVGGTGFWIRALMDEYAGLKPAPNPALRAELAERLANEGLEALADELRRLDPAAHGSVDLRNPHRVCRALERALEPEPALKVQLPAFNCTKFVLDWPAEELVVRIERRLDEAWERGWPAEAASLDAAGHGPPAPAWRAIGYQEAAEAFRGELTELAAKDRIAVLTRKYGKRQRTWLRSEVGAFRLEGRDAVERVREWASARA